MAEAAAAVVVAAIMAAADTAADKIEQARLRDPLRGLGKQH